MKSDYIKKAYDAVRADESLKAKILQKAYKLSEAEDLGENRSNVSNRNKDISR